MGNATDGGESAPVSNDPVDVAQRCRELHSTISQLLSDDALLTTECDRLMPVPEKQVPAAPPQRKHPKEYHSHSDDEDEFEENDEYESEIVIEQQRDLKPLEKEKRISLQELRKVTQCLIDRLGCRQPEVLQRVTAVYAGFVGRRDGLTLMEFRGYVACVLTQLQRELENRCAAAGVRLVDPPIPDAQRHAQEPAKMDSSHCLQERLEHAAPFTAKIERREAADLYVSYEPPTKMDLVSQSVPSNICTASLPSSTEVDFPSTDLCIDSPQQEPDKVAVVEEEEEVSELQMLTRNLDALNKALSSSGDDEKSSHIVSQHDFENNEKPCINFDGLPDLVAATLSNRDALKVATAETNTRNLAEITQGNSSTAPHAGVPSSNVEPSTEPISFSPAIEQQPLVNLSGPGLHTNAARCFGPSAQPETLAMKGHAVVNGHAHLAPAWSACDSSYLPGKGYQALPQAMPTSENRMPTNFASETCTQHSIVPEDQPYIAGQLPYGPELPQSAFCGIQGPHMPGFSPPPPSPPQSPRQQSGSGHLVDAHSVNGQARGKVLTAKDLGVTGYGTASECKDTQANQEPDEDGTSLVNGVVSRFKATGSNLATGWQKFADTMDTIFVPEAVEEDGADVDNSERETVDDGPRIGTLPLQTTAVTDPRYGPSMHPQMPVAGMVPQGIRHPLPTEAQAGGPLAAANYSHYGPHATAPYFGNAPQQAPDDVPLLFRTPSHEEVRDLLELEGLPAYLKLDAGRGFTPKRLCLDSSGETLYVLESDSPVPSFFFGITGFSLEGLRRVRHSVILSPEQKPLVALEFDEGYLMLKLGDPKVFQGFLGVVTSCRDTVDIVAHSDWV